MVSNFSIQVDGKGRRGMGFKYWFFEVLRGRSRSWLAVLERAVFNRCRPRYDGMACKLHSPGSNDS
jgi:hypothetical protein